MSSSEKIVYIHLKSKFVGNNNGELQLHYSELADMMAPATISKAFKKLEANGWIEKTRHGGMFRYACKYWLTGKHDLAFINYRS